MKLRKFSKLFNFLLIIIGLGIGNNVYSQTVVQWYTSMGDFRAQLREDLVPMTAQNFIDLTNDNFYDDLIFHRVIIEFMIQDGCPLGNGYGGPGYTFPDEFHPDLRHDEPGILSMANSGPNTNGSQYFITVVPTTWLDDVHAVFGKIIDGMEVVYAISEVETNANNKPLIDVEIDSIRVVNGDPAIEVTAPLGGSKWNASVENEIAWNSEFVADVKIEFSSDNGQSWTEIVETTSANTRSFDWPAPEITSAECLIKISDAAHPNVFDVCDTPFTLCKLDLTHPSGFCYTRVGSPVEITWTSELVGDLTLAYKTSNIGEWVTIDQGVPATNNSYTWIPEVVTSWCKVRITETAYPDVFDETDNFFLVFRLDLSSPVGGEIIPGNSQFEITWESEIISSIKIEFSSDGGQNWGTVVGSTPAGNSLYNWSVPNINSDECYLKIMTPSLPDLFDINELPFSIVEVMGVSEQSENKGIGFALFPNPVTDEASIAFFNPLEWIGNTEVEILNLSGKVVYSQALGIIHDGNQTVKIDMKGLLQGLYLMKMVAKDKCSSVKFIKK
nr:peptidylprolyl isomerase [Bacteroidota bacterium]